MTYQTILLLNMLLIPAALIVKQIPAAMGFVLQCSNCSICFVLPLWGNLLESEEWTRVYCLIQIL